LRSGSLEIAYRPRLAALLGILALAIVGCSSPLSGPPSQQTAPARVGANPAAMLAEAIHYQSVNPPGNESGIAAFFVQQLRAAGIEAHSIPTPTDASGVKRAAAWGVLRGTGEAPALVLLSHLDTVPADRTRWEVDPFEGVIRSGDVIGRGAQDAKGVGVVQLLAMAELARRSRPLRRDIIFLATPDEETGGRLGAGWISRQRPDLLRDAAYLLTEGGGVQIGKRGVQAWHVAVTEKAPCWLRLSTEGPSGHSSVPPRNAAVPRLVRALDRLRRIEMRTRIVPAVANMYAAMAPLADEVDSRGFADLQREFNSNPDFRRRFLEQRFSRALVQDTFTITVLQGSSRTNVLPARASAHIDARLLPGSSCNDFAARVRRAVGDQGVSIEILLTFPTSISPTDTNLFRAIEQVARATDPDAVMVPHVGAGFTDAHWFRELGLVSYGFVPRWHRAGEQRGVHGPNERISVKNLERGIRTLVEIIEAFDELD